MRAVPRLRVAVFAFAALMVAGLFAAPAGAQSDDYADVLTMTLSTSSTRQCDTDDITVTVDNLQPGSTATFTFYSDPVPLGEATADAEGTVVFVFQIPPGTPLGEHEVVVEGTNFGGVTETETVILEIVSCEDDPEGPGDGGGSGTGPGTGTGTGTGTDSGPLARTGTDLGLPLRIAVIAIAAGAALLLLGRKRQGRTV